MTARFQPAQSAKRPGDAQAKKSDTFKLIGRTNVFRLSGRGRFNYYDIPCVEGTTLDGRLRTVARVADVVFV